MFISLKYIPRKVINQQYNSTQINELTGAFELALECIVSPLAFSKSDNHLFTSHHIDTCVDGLKNVLQF